MVFTYKKSMQFVATFIIMLVVGIPFYSADAYATLSNIEANGSDGVNNYIKEYDYIDFSVEVYYNNETITPDRVWLGQNFQFSSCVAGINSYKCFLRYPENGTNKYDPRAIPYTINLKDTGGNIIESETSTLYVDNIAPTINSFAINPGIVGENGTVNFEIDVVDTACTGSGCQGCSGIKSIEFTTEENSTNSSYSEIVPIISDNCSYSGVIQVPVEKFNDGTYEIYAKATDNLGSVSETRSAEVTVDVLPPEIIPDSFMAVDAEGNEITYASSTPFTYIFSVDIDAPDLDVNNVKGDFSSIGGDNRLSAQCSTQDNRIYTCRWNVAMSIGTDSNSTSAKIFKVYATDLGGNSAEIEVAKSFSLDNTAPRVVSIYTDYLYDNKTYVKQGEETNFFASISEAEAGVSASQVIMYLEGQGVSAVNCTQGWICQWRYTVNSGSFSASITSDSTDRAGNHFTQFSQEVRVDNMPPEIVDITINNTGGEFAAVPGYFKIGDGLVINARIRDETFKDAVLDLSSVINGAVNVTPDSCSRINSTSGNDVWQCTWSTTSMDVAEGDTSRQITFRMKDVVGNELSYPYTITVYGAISGEADYWSSSVECSPRLIDRETTSLINTKSYCRVSLEPKTAGAETLKINLGECEPATALQSTEIFNNDARSVEPYIGLVFKKTNFKVNELELKCLLGITTKANNGITVQPELENVTIKIGLYNNPLGEFSQSMLDEIKSAVEDANGVWKIIEYLKKIEFYAKRLCQLLDLYYKIVAIWNNVTALLGDAEDTAATVPPTKAAIYSKRLGACIRTEKTSEETNEYFKMGDKFCAFVNCKAYYEKDGAYGQSYGNKWQQYFMGDEKKGGGVIGSLGGDFIKDWTAKDPLSYMNPKDSLVVSLMMACIPGVIHNLDKYRQIKCAYANCLYSNAAQQGLPISACQDQKSYAQCKYIFGEIFSVIPFTAIFDHYANLVKDVLSNPFKILGSALAASCLFHCSNAATEKPHSFCRSVKLIAMIGNVLQDVTSIIDEGFFEIKGDYCENLEDIEQWADEQSTPGDAGSSSSGGGNETAV